MRKGSTVVSVYLDPEMYLFMSDIARCEGRSRTRQIEKIIRDWMDKWVKEHGPGARQKMRALIYDMDAELSDLRQVENN